MEDEQNNTIVVRKMFMVKRLFDDDEEATEGEVREKEDPPAQSGTPCPSIFLHSGERRDGVHTYILFRLTAYLPEQM